MYKVSVKKKVIKNIAKLPLWVQKKVAVLAMDLKDKGPEQPNWQNDIMGSASLILKYFG